MSSTKPPEGLATGQQWAYRESAYEPVTPVEVLSIGTKKPLRAQVRFVDDAHQGRVEWVPPSRLKVKWSDIEGWQERENRWAAVRAESDGINDDSPEIDALEYAFRDLTGDRVIEVQYRRDAGVLKVLDLDELTARVGIDPSEITGHQLSFAEDDGTVVAPWSVTLKLARCVAKQNADFILAEIKKEEAEEQIAAIHGHHYRSSGRNPNDYYMPPERCIEWAKRHEPGRKVVREWCGIESIERFDELQALRDEVHRLGALVEEAVVALRNSSCTAYADRIERKLGVSIETVRLAAKKN